MPESLDEALAVLAGLVVNDDGHRWGEIAEPLQWEDARAVLDVDSPTPYHFLTRARGRSKTSDLGAIVISAMLTQLGRGTKCYAAAANRDQAALLVDAIRAMTSRTPELGGVFEVQANKVICDRRGVELTTMSADVSGAYGLLPGFIVVDEIAQWPTTKPARLFYEAIRTAAPKVRGCRMVLLTSAGHPAHWSAKALAHARKSKTWRVNEAHGPAPWMSRDLLEEQREALPDSAYRRYYLNEWTEGDDGIQRTDVEACLRPGGALAYAGGNGHLIGVDLSVVSDYTVVSVAHLERADAESIVVVDHLRTWKPTRRHPVPLGEVAEHVAEMAKVYRARVAADPYQAQTMLQALQGMGVHAEPAQQTAGGNNRRATLMFQLIRNHRLSLPSDDPELVDELASLTLRESSPGMYKLDSDVSGIGHHDRATAISIAAEKLLERPSEMSGHQWLAAYYETHPNATRSARTDWETLRERARAKRQVQSAGRPATVHAERHQMPRFGASR